MTITDRVRKYMIEELGSRMMAWEMTGPLHTNVDLIQCWGIPVDVGDASKGIRLVIVEIFDDGGFEVFPQVMKLDLAGTTEVIKRMGELEQ